MYRSHSSRNTPFRVLMVSGVFPTEHQPHKGTFVKSQVDSLAAIGVEAEVIHPKPGPIPIRYLEATIRVFIKTLTGKFDIVHGHYGLWCLAARLQWITPVVASFIGDDLLGTPIDSGHYSRKSLFVVKISRWLCRHVDAVIVKSEEMKLLAANENVIVMPDGVDFGLFRPMSKTQARIALGWEQNRYYILFGNDPTIFRKNYPLALAAVELLREKGLPVELVVATGLSQAALVDYLNASDALILTSLLEGSPNGVKEAMACNLPVISVDVGDVAQIISNTAGCNVCPADPNAIASALEVACLRSEPTTGRTDIAHLEDSIVVKQIMAVYEQAKQQKARKKAFYLKTEYIDGSRS